MNEDGRGRISVIVPVYNVSDYLDRCLKTIVTQSYRNLEIILIDDGSRDDSGSISEMGMWSWPMAMMRTTIWHDPFISLWPTRNR